VPDYTVVVMADVSLWVTPRCGVRRRMVVIDEVAGQETLSALRNAGPLPLVVAHSNRTGSLAV
jgi:hypothetical protein